MLQLAMVMPAMAQERDIASGRWDFVATLDGKPIGTHRFTVAGPAAARRVESRAQFSVRLLGIPVYRYRHRAEERWQDDCLRELRADTDDDGREQQVARRFDDECVMAYAYWNPLLVRQTRLVDPQTGQAGPVRFEPLPEAAIELHGRPVAARGWRLVSETQRITAWYATEGGRWIGLDAEARGGRQLRYRLSAEKDPP
ncbi:hypothetical protein G8A07_17380 [Roseateles sp. DAIF2]|uniref:DUF6134 family protein n=1 Tax=Roseateles sp. DAIF2 TaxID=2714952 RepID=UPI0018A31121|nr:DUF6134 family protein [Roseateles sp. DAIF2]QPF74512.1 hypothetical protein G8A07_17380 [Roseateles sp. DAIF2]